MEELHTRNLLSQGDKKSETKAGEMEQNKQPRMGHIHIQKNQNTDMEKERKRKGNMVRPRATSRKLDDIQCKQRNRDRTTNKSSESNPEIFIRTILGLPSGITKLSHHKKSKKKSKVQPRRNMQQIDRKDENQGENGRTSKVAETRDSDRRIRRVSKGRGRDNSVGNKHATGHKHQNVWRRPGRR